MNEKQAHYCELCEPDTWTVAYVQGVVRGEKHKHKRVVWVCIKHRHLTNALPQGKPAAPTASQDSLF